MLPCQPGGEGHSAVSASQAKALPDVFNNLLWKDFSRACLLRDNNQGARDACLPLHNQQKKKKKVSKKLRLVQSLYLWATSLWWIFVKYLCHISICTTCQMHCAAATVWQGWAWHLVAKELFELLNIYLSPHQQLTAHLQRKFVFLYLCYSSSWFQQIPVLMQN